MLPPSHHFTMDVEEYFHPTALTSTYPPEAWNNLPRRSAPIVERCLDLLADRGIRGTFFILGWLAEREPALVRRITAQGHEVASHGWGHRLVTTLSPQQFRESVHRSKALLEDLSGESVLGYRAPSFSIVPGGEWAFDVLIEEGYLYDSSLVPITLHPTYGYPQAPKHPHWIHRGGGQILEFPLTTLTVGGRELPMAGGAYFRFAPYSLFRHAFRKSAGRGIPGTFYLHPWELDPDPPRLDASLVTRLRTQWSTGDTWMKMEALTKDLPFRRMDETLAQMSP